MDEQQKPAYFPYDLCCGLSEDDLDQAKRTFQQSADQAVAAQTLSPCQTSQK